MLSPKRQIFAASLLSAFAGLVVVAGWLAASRRDFDVSLSQGMVLRVAASGFRFNGDSGGWEWTTTRVNVRGFVPDGWKTSFSLVRRPPRTDPYYPTGWFDERVFTVRAHNLVCGFFAMPCVLLAMRFRRRRLVGFPVGTTTQRNRPDGPNDRHESDLAGPMVGR